MGPTQLTDGRGSFALRLLHLDMNMTKQQLPADEQKPYPDDRNGLSPNLKTVDVDETISGDQQPGKDDDTGTKETPS